MSKNINSTKWQAWQNYAENQNIWLEHQEQGLLKAVHIRDYILQLWFEEELDVTIYELDFYPLLIEECPGPVYHALKEPERFELIRGDYALIWLNPKTYAYDEGVIDIAPECIRFFCERYGRLIKGASPVGCGANPTPAPNLLAADCPGP